ncbi:MAG TPA: PTS sugar transporter subunit IIA [Lachnospiraceae bacterium]|nr:PTS sugar transporter subunit IIA [Lachnospiraceae bacterium]
MIRDMLKPEYIFIGQKPASHTLADALALISERCSPYAGVKATALTKAFLAREKMGSTGFGEQLAIPHAKVRKLKQPMIALFRFTEGVDWNAMDGQPVKLAIALVMPKEDKDNTHLTILAKLSRRLVHPEFMEALLSAETEEALYKYIIEEMEENK